MNVKMIPVETILGTMNQEISGGVNSSMIYLMHFKNVYKWHSVPPPCTTIKTNKHTKKKYPFQESRHRIWRKNSQGTQKEAKGAL
jgi:hypothetical protein